TTRVFRHRYKNFTSVHPGDGLSTGSVISLFEDHSGTLWIITTGGLNTYKDGKFIAYTTRDGLASDSIETLVEDQQGSIWIGSSDGLTRFKDGVFTNFSDLGGTRPTLPALT